MMDYDINEEQNNIQEKSFIREKRPVSAIQRIKQKKSSPIINISSQNNLKVVAEERKSMEDGTYPSRFNNISNVRGEGG